MLKMDLEIIPKAERERRSKILHALSDRKLKAFYQSQHGREAVVLWESKNDKGIMHGFTENYVKVSCPYDKAKINTFERIEIMCR